MTSLMHNHTERADQVKAAMHRFKRYNLWAAIAAIALFGVLTVKAQVLPPPSWSHPVIGWSNDR